MSDVEVQSKKYDQAFFLDLAAKGKDEWNVRRRELAKKDVRVTFAGIDFSEAPRDRIDFSWFEFGHRANFSGCKWRGAEWVETPEAFKPGRACFTGAVFDDFANFCGAVSGVGAAFPRATFGRWANFDGASFDDGASFAGATFGVAANFAHAVIGQMSSFAGAVFDHTASFANATFGHAALFTDAAFGHTASFGGAGFGGYANFSQTHFNGHVQFTGKSKEQWRRDFETKAVQAVQADEKTKAAIVVLKKRHEDSWERDNSGPDRFLTISFAHARFDGEANFSGRTFDEFADFTNARFYRLPNFDGVTNASRIDFTGAHIGFVRPGRPHWTSNTKVPLRVRALRKIAEETKNHDLERDLYIEERKAERGVYLHQLLGLDELKKSLEDINEQKKHVWLEWRLQRRARNAHWLGILAKPDKIARLFTHLLWIAVIGIYWALADHGRSFARPATWLVLSGFFFYWCYGKILAPLMAKAPDIEKYKQVVRMLAHGNTVPFVGPLTIDSKVKEFLFCPCRNCPDPLIPPEGYQLLVLGQNLFSITCVFFIGLALRNYFRIK